jgi:hypothetical protein
VNGTGGPFFIVGCPRSGTTLLSVLVDRHSRLCVPPETAFFDDVAPRLAPRGAASGHLLQVLRGWRRLAELGLEPEAVLRRLPDGPAAPGAVLAAILGLYAERQGKVRCGEKTPQHLPHVPTILREFPGAKILCLLRDGRDAALSMNAMPWWAPQDLASAARLWTRSVRLADRFVRRYPGQFLVVRYEDLVTAPQRVLSSAMQHLGETFEERQVATELASHVVLPRSLGWKGRALGAIEAGQVGRRRAEATAAERAFLERIHARELRRPGYAATGAPDRAAAWRALAARGRAWWRSHVAPTERPRRDRPG